MTYWDRLWRIELCAALVVIIAAAAMSAYEFYAAASEAARGALVVFTYAWVLGTIAATLFGAPLYAALSQAKKATWWYAVIVGITPGIAVVFAEGPYPRWAWFFLMLGPIVALVTHWLASFWLDRTRVRKHAAI